LSLLNLLCSKPSKSHLIQSFHIQCLQHCWIKFMGVLLLTPLNSNAMCKGVQIYLRLVQITTRRTLHTPATLVNRFFNCHVNYQSALKPHTVTEMTVRCTINKMQTRRKDFFCMLAQPVTVQCGQLND
jgi:hypothetical protein